MNALGYGRADLARTAMKQMRRLNHISNLFTTEPALALARAMLAQGPFAFSSVFFGNSGTEANEAALKYARLYSYADQGARSRKAPLLLGRLPRPNIRLAVVSRRHPKYQDPYLPLVPGVVVAPVQRRRGPGAVAHGASSPGSSSR